MIEDFDLIVSSFRTQYGVKVYSNEFKEMRWDEFCALLSGLSANTPLGRIIQIRSEDDENVLKNFTKGQHQIRSEWRNRRAQKMTQQQTMDFLEQMKRAFIAMAGGDKD